MKLVENLTAFAAETSIHGLNFIAKSKTVLMQGIWFPLFTASLAYAIVQIMNEAKCTYDPTFADFSYKSAIFKTLEK